MPRCVNLEPEALRSLVEEVGRFYVRDRSLSRAQRSMAEALANGGVPGEPHVHGYLEAVRRYFTGFEAEAQAHLQRVDARLKRVSQEQFNLTAERGVAARRVEATRSVLERLPGRGT